MQWDLVDAVGPCGSSGTLWKQWDLEEAVGP